MTLIKPHIEYSSHCPYCGNNLSPQSIIWHGMHVCVESRCSVCLAEIIGDLSVGHAVNYPYLIDIKNHKFFGTNYAHKNIITDNWLGLSLLNSFQNPINQQVEIQKEVFKSFNRVIVLNCIDHLYGHTLLKLLNSDRHLQNNPDFGLIIVIQKFLRWMVPEGVAEVWTLDIPLILGQSYYPNINKFILNELDRFDEVHLSSAHSHPSDFDITNYTKVPKHDFKDESFRITFVWREDRIWINFFIFRVLRKLKLDYIYLMLQNWKVRRLLKAIKKRIPSATFTVAGLGRKTKFPDWIDDMRVNKFNEKSERITCELYSKSRLVIGLHGSNMLLPSAHAGMTIDLMPVDRLSNICQDILYQKVDPRLSNFCYRFPSAEITINQLVETAVSMIKDYDTFSMHMRF